MYSNERHQKNCSDDSFHLESDQSDSEEQKEVYKPRNQKSDFEGLIEGSWTQTQKGLFLAFMDYHRNIFLSKRKRKAEKIFRFMADFLGNRNPAQCRSHFQKLIKKYRRVRYIFNEAYKEYEETQYKKYYNEVVLKLSQLKQKQEVKLQSTQKPQVKEQEPQSHKSIKLSNNFPSSHSLSYLILSQNNLNSTNMIQNELIKQEDEVNNKKQSINTVKTQQ